MISLLHNSKNKNKNVVRRFVFFGRNSGIHGLRHVFYENAIILTRVFWIFILLLSSGCMYLILVPVIERGDEINFTPDTRYLPWTTTFPAVTVCEIFNHRMVQRKFVALYPDLMESMTYDFRKYLSELVYSHGTCSKTFCVPCGSIVPCDLSWRDIVDKVHKKCSEILTDCSFNGKEFPCCKNFRSVDSEYGYCYSFNTLQNENSYDEPLYRVNRTTGPGKLNFRIMSDAQDKVMFPVMRTGVKDNVYLYKISVHSTEELSTNFLDYKFKFDVKTHTENWVEFLFSVVEMENDVMLHNEEISVRGCRYIDEIPNKPLHYYSVYSYGACSLAERTYYTYKHCGCVHPVRHPSCQNVRVVSDKHNTQKDYKCLPSCVESELTAIHISRQWLPDNINTGTLVNVRMISLPTLRYKRNLIRTKLDFVVSIGGVVGLFFGASILSIVEIIYLICRPQNKKM